MVAFGNTLRACHSSPINYYTCWVRRWLYWPLLPFLEWTTFLSLIYFVVMATLFQAFFILHFVHWHWNRFDLSLDAVIKYFSCGFVLCTGIGVFLELIMSVLLDIIRNIIVLIIVLACDKTDLPNSADSAREFAKEFQHNHLWLFCIFTFLNCDYMNSIKVCGVEKVLCC
jgi:hypothetical protein